jgi:carboxylesterase type B
VNKFPYRLLPTIRFLTTNICVKIYTFQNIRFGAPAVGDLRWAPPATPQFNGTISDGSYGPKCIQAKKNYTGPAKISDDIVGAEDCLFLNLFVPGKALLAGSASKLPIIVWIYGGAYTSGSKDGNFDGTGILESAQGQAIFIAGNYRVGAFGFLNGDTMEKEATPNAGIYDQRAVFEWVQKYAPLFGGDKTKVTAWGESAGAGSLMHHLVLHGGKTDPLFRRVLFQSPAINPVWDRKGEMERAYKAFEKRAGCEGKGVACLRIANVANLTTANNAGVAESPHSTYQYGPQPDGNLIRQLPALELAAGNYWKEMNSVIASHVRDEAFLFVDPRVTNDAKFTDFLYSLYPGTAFDSEVGNVETFYPNVSIKGSPYDSEISRQNTFLRDNSFNCNTRWIATAYRNITYNLQYGGEIGFHGTDIRPTFSTPKSNDIDKAYQSYLVSHARSGNPNTYRMKNPGKDYDTLEWGHVDISGEQPTGVLYVERSKFSIITDTASPLSHCNFWFEIQKNVTQLDGATPPPLS